MEWSLAEIGEAIGTRLNFSQLYNINDTMGLLRLRVAWMPSQNVSALLILLTIFPH
jgi:hypothetical protein